MSGDEQPFKKAKTEATDATIILVCAEGVKVAIPLDHAMQCKVLAELLRDHPIEGDEVTPQIPVTTTVGCLLKLLVGPIGIWKINLFGVCLYSSTGVRASSILLMRAMAILPNNRPVL